MEDEVPVKYQSEFRYLDTQGSALEQIEKVIELPEKAQAPLEEGAQAGVARYLLNGKEIGTTPILYAKEIAKAGFSDYFKKVFGFFLL